MKLAALAAAISAVAANEKIDAKDVVQLVDGFLNGALKEGGFDDIEKCVTDSEVIFKDTEDAYNHFKAKHITDIAKGF